MVFDIFEELFTENVIVDGSFFDKDGRTFAFYPSMSPVIWKILRLELLCESIKSYIRIIPDDLIYFRGHDSRRRKGQFAIFLECVVDKWKALRPGGRIEGFLCLYSDGISLCDISHW